MLKGILRSDRLKVSNLCKKMGIDVKIVHVWTTQKHSWIAMYIRGFKYFENACSCLWDWQKVRTVKEPFYENSAFFFPSMHTMHTICSFRIRKLKSEKWVKTITSFPWEMYRCISVYRGIWKCIYLPAVRLSYLIFI